MANSLALVKVTDLIRNQIDKPVYSQTISFSDYDDMEVTPEEGNRIEKYMSKLTTGASAVIPLICPGGASCPFSQNCPFWQEDVRRQRENALHSSDLDERMDAITLKPLVVKGRACLVELRLLDEWTKLFIDEYGIDDSSFTDFQMVRELAETELMMWRINNNMSKPEHAEFTQETIVGVSKQGDTLFRTEVSALYEVKERLQNRKSKLIKLMVGDRQEKYKREAALHQRTEEDPSISAAHLRSQIDRLLYQAKTLAEKGRIEDGGGIIDVTEVNSSSPIDSLSPEDIIGGEE